MVLLSAYAPLSVFGKQICEVYLKNRFLAPKARLFIDDFIEKIGDPLYWDCSGDG